MTLVDHGSLDFDLLARVGLAALLGVFIGVERQWRERMASLQTMALVSMGSALFVIFGAYGFSSGDPTRVAAQIVSGIGFLGAGVIIKQGKAITGLNTAATLWASAAVGSLAGAWMWREAVAGAVIIFGGNVGLHAVGRAIDGRTLHAHTGVMRILEFSCEPAAESDIRQTLLSAQYRSRVRITGLTTYADPGGTGRLRVRAGFSVAGTGVRRIDRMTRDLYIDERVNSIQWIDGDANFGADG